jgi:clathrin heavy chain
MLEEGVHADVSNTVHTELAILYSKYAPHKLMKHISNFHDKITIPKVAAVCEKNQQWSGKFVVLIVFSCFYDVCVCVCGGSGGSGGHSSLSLYYRSSFSLLFALSFFIFLLFSPSVLPLHTLALLIQRG